MVHSNACTHHASDGERTVARAGCVMHTCVMRSSARLPSAGMRDALMPVMLSYAVLAEMVHV